MVVSTPDIALERAHGIISYDVGYCLRWVRSQWAVEALFGSAIEAWHGARHQHPGDRHPPPGAPLFYAGGQYGHIVIADWADHEGMRSTDCRSSGWVNDEDIGWVERTWGYSYLGWTEDLNGVQLPLHEEEDEMTPEDWDKLRRIVREEVHDAVPHYVSSFLAGIVSEDPETTVKKSLRLSAEHARDG